jgi:hypothetical protein
MTLSPPGGSPQAARSTQLNVIPQSKEASYKRIRLNPKARPKREAP